MENMGNPAGYTLIWFLEMVGVGIIFGIILYMAIRNTGPENTFNIVIGAVSVYQIIGVYILFMNVQEMIEDSIEEGSQEGTEDI
jgi:Na+-transporting NADH:ubiquinone oxidoreductase subunit NqrD